jgi:hypothetical protein
MTVPTVEDRLAVVEREIAELKRRLPAEPLQEDWVDAMSGVFADDPEFDEVVRLGREMREADRMQYEEQ